MNDLVQWERSKMTDKDNYDLIRANLQADMEARVEAQVTVLRSSINTNIQSPLPQPCVFESPFICGVDFCLTDYKLDCYYFTFEQMMGAHIPLCRKFGTDFACKDCDRFISQKEADKIIEEVIKK